MRFSDLPIGSLVLYTYNYTSSNRSSEISTEVVIIIAGKAIQTVFSSFDHITYTGTMDYDDRATFISPVSSVDDAIQRFPELFV